MSIIQFPSACIDHNPGKECQLIEIGENNSHHGIGTKHLDRGKGSGTADGEGYQISQRGYGNGYSCISKGLFHSGLQ